MPANHVTEHLHQALRYQHIDGHTKAKKAYITDDIWEIRNNKIKYKKKIKDIARRIKFDTLAFFFKAWHDPEQSTHLLECRFYDATMRCAMFKYKICLRKVRFQLKKSLTAAKQRRLEEELQSLTPSTSAPTVLNKLKSFVGPTNPKKKKQKPFLMIRNDAGNKCHLPTEAMEVWIRFFQNMEGGTRVTQHTLREQWLQELQEFQHSHLQVPLADIPTLTDLELASERT